MNVLVLAHGKEITPGWLSDALAEIDARDTLIDLSLGDELPVGKAADWDKVVVLGGHMGAYDVGDHPWLAAEKRFIKLQLTSETPVLGVCLGAQLLAEVIGGSAYRAEVSEVGFIDLQYTSEGLADAAVGAIEGPVVTWHHDTFDLPGDAELLASTSNFPHAFRHQTALGVQFHPELTPDMWARWVEMEGTADFEAAGVDPAPIGRRVTREADRLRTQAIAFFRAWLEE